MCLNFASISSPLHRHQGEAENNQMSLGNPHTSVFDTSPSSTNRNHGIAMTSRQNHPTSLDAILSQIEVEERKTALTQRQVDRVPPAALSRPLLTEVPSDLNDSDSDLSSNEVTS
jgi:hypothetical protein